MKQPSLFEKRKRRILGEVITPSEARADNASLSIHGSSKEALLTFESAGLVVAVHGGGSLQNDHPQVQDAQQLGKSIAKRGGIVFTGGRNSGIMGAATTGAGEQAMGVIFPELEKESKASHMAKVNSPTPRIELLATCAPITAIYRGGMGTLMVLMRAIVHVRNRAYHPDQPPQMVFVSSYWIALLTSMMSMGALKREFLTELKFFDTSNQILSAIPKQ